MIRTIPRERHPVSDELDALEADIRRLANELNTRLERWLALVAKFDRLGGARRLGFRGTAAWLATTCGIGLRAAREHVRVARELEARRQVREAFAAGVLSYSKVRALTRVPAGDADAALIELARTSTASEVECVVRGLRTAASARLDVANAAHHRRHLDWWWEEDGSLSIRGRLAGDDAVAFIEAVDTGAAALRAPHDGADAGRVRPLGAQRADALAEIALSGCPRTHVVLHVDEPALACTRGDREQPAGELCALEAGPAVPSETARRLACDGELMVARDDGASVVELGRRRRVVSPALRLAIERRDQHCRFPGCERRHGLQAHHIVHWAHGGRTDRSNLMLLCRFHHRLVHEEGFTVEGQGVRTEFRRPDGRLVPGPAPSSHLPADTGPTPPRCAA